ncbi:MAG TPA: MBL fold metallo-hydrolase [Sulfurovum sp.]|uniref:MBL fold metallo-hydrolase n=1 Tax=Sulfurovum sp. TaxID=1969726 RepID=UPI002F92CFAF
MKSMIVLCLSFLTLQAYEYHLKPVELAKDVYCFFGAPENISKENGGNMVNTCFVKTKEGFVVIDSGPTFGYAQQAYAQMQEIAKLPVKFVITTHDHDDHWLGNNFYKSKGALLMGPKTYEQNVIPGMSTRMEESVGKETYAGTEVVKLDSVVEQKYDFTLGDTVFEIKQLVDQAHTKGDLVVYLPQKKVLFAGDLVFNDRLSSLRDGSIIGSLKALDLIDSFQADVIVGGHGYATDANATQPFKRYLVEMKKQILEALEEDVGIDEITKRVVMPEYKDMNLYDVLHRRNVFDAYTELEMYDEDEE